MSYFVYVLNNHCHRVTTQLQLINIIIIITTTTTTAAATTTTITAATTHNHHHASFQNPN